ncbi:MAG TPA: MoaD/ThiS family protein [Elusimicrobiota bacterium]|nr:MoaD/ThiS family protein [Elusimicrobiota bacterium]
MPVKVRIPAPLRMLTKNQPVVSAEGKTVVEILKDLEGQYPGLWERLCDETGHIRRFVNIFVNGEDVRGRGDQAAPVPDGAEVSIVPAIAGGVVRS